jgi:mannose-6-phosphate isomerase-like protein (cupin superfamily)
LDRTLLASGHRAHLGAGDIQFRRLFGVLRDRSKHPDRVNEKTQYREDFGFSSNLAFVDHAVAMPGTSVGYHRHDGMEECQIFIGGSALMKVDGEVTEVSEGDCVPNRLGGTHGLINHTDTPTEFIAIAVSCNRGEIDFTNLDDDLRGLL